MKYGEGIFNRTRDPRALPPGQPMAANAPSLGPTPAHPAPRPAAAAPSVAADPAPRAEEAGGSKLIVGPNIKLKGVEIHDCDTLVVEGRVESALDSRVIQIAENGVFNGAASIDIAEIRGRFDGELTARKQLVIHASGRVAGKIRYGNIKIEEGGEISGDVGSLGAHPAKT